MFFGWLSDRVGRKPVMLSGMVIVALAIFPGFQQVTRAANPALVEASERAPVSVVADPADCALQFDPIGKSQFRSACDIAKTVLANAGIPYTNVAAPAGSLAEVRIGSVVVPSVDGRALDAAALAALKAEVGGRVRAALQDAGYPPSADPARADIWQVFALLMILVVGATALYGPQAACLVELFPTRIRYTALSLPYHIGTGWVGGFLPATAYAMTVATGDIYFGLWYPVVAITLSIVVTALFLPETRHRALRRRARLSAARLSPGRPSPGPAAVRAPGRVRAPSPAPAACGSSGCRGARSRAPRPASAPRARPTATARAMAARSPANAPRRCTGTAAAAPRT